MEAQKGNLGAIWGDFECLLADGGTKRQFWGNVGGVEFLLADGGPGCGILGQSGGILSSCWQMEAQDVEFWGNLGGF